MTERWDRLVPPVIAATAHLGEEEFAAVDISAAASKHLADCAWCQTRRSTLSDVERDDLAALLGELDAAPAAGDVLKVAAGFAVPSALAALLHADSASMPSVEPAQLWRMVWNGHDALGVVLEKNSWWVTVAPLTTDQDLADEYTALCDAHATTLGFPTAVFMRAAATVPQYTLAQFLGELRPAGVADPSAELRRLQRACLKGIDPPSAIPTGRRLEVDDWDRQEALDGLVELMGWFEAATSDVLDATGAIVGGEQAGAVVIRDASGDEVVRDEGGRHRGNDVAGDESVDVVDALKNSGKGLRELVESTGLEPARLLDLLQGGGRPTQAERGVLGKVLGMQVGGSYPDVARLALLEIVSEPEHRPLWKAKVSIVGAGADRWPADPRGFGHERASGGHHPRHSSEMDAGESVRPFLEQMLTQSVAARSVTDANRSDDGSLEAWRDYWRDRIAHRKH